MKVQCDICHDFFKPTTIENRFTLVECERCHHEFCLKHITSRDVESFLRPFLDDLSHLKSDSSINSRELQKRAFRELKIHFRNEHHLGSSQNRLSPSEMAHLLKDMDEQTHEFLPSIRTRFPASLCPYCQLEVISTETLLAYSLIELSKYRPQTSEEELLNSLITEFKQTYHSLEEFENQFKNREED